MNRALLFVREWKHYVHVRRNAYRDLPSSQKPNSPLTRARLLLLTLHLPSSTALEPPPQLPNLPLRQRRVRTPKPRNQHAYQTPFRRHSLRAGSLAFLVLHAVLGEDCVFLGGWVLAECFEHGEFFGVEDGGGSVVAGDDGGGDGVGGDHGCDVVGLVGHCLLTVERWRFLLFGRNC